ncbi:hypothetical protein Tco_1142523 [Tanacetum coccineum]
MELFPVSVYEVGESSTAAIPREDGDRLLPGFHETGYYLSGARQGACNPAAFRRVEGAVKLRRWFEKTKSVFEISECAEGKEVKFAAATLKGPALTWWKTKVATIGLETMNKMPWTEMKQLMTAEICPIEEIQLMEHKL